MGAVSSPLVVGVLMFVLGGATVLIVEHGWGWIMAWLRAYRDEAASKAEGLYGEVQDQVSSAIDARVRQVLGDVGQMVADAKADWDRLVPRVDALEKQAASFKEEVLRATLEAIKRAGREGS